MKFIAVLMNIYFLALLVFKISYYMGYKKVKFNFNYFLYGYMQIQLCCLIKKETSICLIKILNVSRFFPK